MQGNEGLEALMMRRLRLPWRGLEPQEADPEKAKIQGNEIPQGQNARK